MYSRVVDGKNTVFFRPVENFLGCSPSQSGFVIELHSHRYGRTEGKVFKEPVCAKAVNHRKPTKPWRDALGLTCQPRETSNTPSRSASGSGGASPSVHRDNLLHQRHRPSAQNLTKPRTKDWSPSGRIHFYRRPWFRIVRQTRFQTKSRSKLCRTSPRSPRRLGVGEECPRLPRLRRPPRMSTSEKANGL